LSESQSASTEPAADSSKPAAGYGHFRNPLGLVWRMLKSGKRAALAALAREGLGKLAIPVDALLAGRERRLARPAPSNEHPLIFIVGPPRSGTTMIYQVLAYCLDVTFPNNLSSMFPRSSTTVSGLATKRRSDFNSYYGQTARMSGANDGFHIWNRWLGDDRYAARTELSEEERADMQQFFSSWTAKYDKPFLNKNNRNVQCIRLLADCLPNAFFVAVNRDPVCVARSLIHARQLVHGDKSAGWGLQCQEVHCEEEPLGYVNDVCDQVRRNLDELNGQLDQLDPARYINIPYEAFCTDPDTHVDLLLAKVDGLQRRPDTLPFGMDTFKISKSRPLTDDEESLIRELLQ